MITGLQLLRHVDRNSVVHRADARSKVLALTVLVTALSFDPSWSSVIVVWALVFVGFIASRLPIGVVPRLPRPVLWAIGMGLGLGLIAGGGPSVSVGPASIGVGGLLLELRFFSVSFGLLALALLLGWTTALGDLPRAAAWMLAPLRALRIPTDDVAAGLMLAVRVLPLMADELATAWALWRVRPTRQSNRVADGIDFAATATVAATRRASELGESLANRGAIVVPTRHDRWSRADAVVALAALVALVIVILVP